MENTKDTLRIQKFCLHPFVGAGAGAVEQPAASKTGKYIAPGLREGAANRRGETMPRSQRGTI